MFDDVHGLTPDRAARLTSLVEQSLPLFGQERGMEAVQRFLHSQGASVIDSIVVTRELLGAGQGSLGTAKEIVLTSAARTTELREHQRLVQGIEEA
ncbi:hypothetical protein OG552_34365 [Streptomyces sp. NBC_01476]|uniref:hypothetical protein n=1 Tax=Streptomyces sp. NBC_01476 TaxID=2903881 RepID=UPI002E31A5D7|nr:hypothetical protein [Streptomyces sp. NBC_01476]